MNPGDRIRIHMHDTPAGFRVDLTDLTTGKHGSMTASIGQRVRPHPVHPQLQHLPGSALRVPPRVLDREPAGKHLVGRTPTTWPCPMRSATSRTAWRSTRTATAPRRAPRTRAWTRTTPAASLATDSTVVKIDGCIAADEDFDGQSYRNDWPGTNPNPFLDRALHPTPVLFTSPTDPRKELFDHRVRDRPAAHRSRGLAGQPAVLRPDYRCQLRQPAGRRAVLSVLLHHVPPRSMHLAAGRPVHPGHGE